jgi:hypothetical protein
MRERNYLRIAGAGIAALLLVLLPLATGGTRFEWIGVPFWAPGFFGSAIVFNTGIHSDHPIAYMALAVFLNFALVWIVILGSIRLIRKIALGRSPQE